MTTLSPDFLTAAMLVADFKGREMIVCKAALLHMALTGLDFNAAELPGEVTNGNTHLAGCATGSLSALGLIVCVGRVKSPRPDAKGRKLDVWRLADGKRGTVLAWLRKNNMPLPADRQLEIAI